MREIDEQGISDEVKKAQQSRAVRSISGFTIAFAGVIFALYNPDQALLGFGAALVGAGLVDPSQVLNFFLRK